jgi:transposase-like protein
MLVPRQQYSRELKIAAMREIDSGKGIAEVARMYQLSPKRLETWKGEWRKTKLRRAATSALTFMTFS